MNGRDRNDSCPHVTPMASGQEREARVQVLVLLVVSQAREQAGLPVCIQSSLSSLWPRFPSPNPQAREVANPTCGLDSGFKFAIFEYNYGSLKTKIKTPTLLSNKGFLSATSRIFVFPRMTRNKNR